ncbi:MAG: bifunctional pyr operon transcriptional regulator/uracil phosphoribosyltransferase [Pseudomonadales bacterium]|jgi:pyrimidine operon attenuation protein / uracil phosphoribosyltransferase|uniref:bifunctional pyr operon transcriptional regulator/uracil phosphoribosyltransferase PyrR n=1 Tax=unclassified Ketobacter TaxID=2639109 RepID=UPI000C9198C6|nr:MULTISPECIES: bifunctional pyr operon transcriptional regulator/uracil phosphoribosyltransferase PyrR [unclassified Ketobacter]MAQ27804.1 bifunctional pyr operon transcriptional regulator/uracil phosphoribosyltransferase [Pseudomonadales bacterium]MEC8810194.1 bifunctional pyr operon transcriptional regulator/uracil phosphoribosyltransferase PyrR [Pseudomonadota bacterium]TNC88957.1 MAG: bifunctional pyr operon transcriptional regulator/uracil phosphoribosyltransferase [Alcanivorax sp.]HAG97|tara:strand:+ start:6487 stop:6993 length:507 start_codon:yes stop_codon:yes gene_type:complete
MTMPQVAPLLDTMASDITRTLLGKRKQEPAMVGIHTGGAWLAKELHKTLGLKQALGLMDISFYRDDFQGKGLHPQVKPSNLPFNVEGQHIILVDDVIMSGRTIRAALNELFDYGRPACVSLVALVDLQRRELPIQPDVWGIRMDLDPKQRIKLSGPEPLTLTLIEPKA